MTSKIGFKPLARGPRSGRWCALPGFRGTSAAGRLTPGRYRMNPYAYTVLTRSRSTVVRELPEAAWESAQERRSSRSYRRDTSGVVTEQRPTTREPRETQGDSGKRPPTWHLLPGTPEEKNDRHREHRVQRDDADGRDGHAAPDSTQPGDDTAPVAGFRGDRLGGLAAKDPLVTSPWQGNRVSVE